MGFRSSRWMFSMRAISAICASVAVRQTTGQDAVYIPQREDIAAHLAAIAQSGDIVLTMGAGDIWKTGEELVALLEGK